MKEKKQGEAAVSKPSDPFLDEVGATQVLKAPEAKLQLKMPIKFKWVLKSELEGGKLVHYLAQEVPCLCLCLLRCLCDLVCSFLKSN